MIVENSGLLTVAALKQLDVKNKKIVCILSGGNMGRDHHVLRCAARPDPEGQDLLPVCPSAGQAGRTCAGGERCGQCPGQCHQAGAQQFVSINRNAAVELRITLEAFNTRSSVRSWRLWRKRDTSQGRSAPSCIKKRSCIHRPYCRRGDPAFAVWLFLFYILVDTSCIIVYNYTRTPDSGTRTDGALDLKER